MIKLYGSDMSDGGKIDSTHMPVNVVQEHHKKKLRLGIEEKNKNSHPIQLNGYNSDEYVIVTITYRYKLQREFRIDTTFVFKNFISLLF